MNLDPIALRANLKDSLGINEDDPSFDSELNTLILGALGTLKQVGAVRIDETNQVWVTDFTELGFSIVEQYLFTYTRIRFDPPAPSTLAILKEHESELIWRIELEHEGIPTPEGDS